VTSTGGVLAPLAARFVRPVGGPPPVIPPEPAGVVWAMPIVLRLERPPAPRTPVLEAAAAAALALCLDPRAAQGGASGDPQFARHLTVITANARRVHVAHD